MWWCSYFFWHICSTCSGGSSWATPVVLYFIYLIVSVGAVRYKDHLDDAYTDLWNLLKWWGNICAIIYIALSVQLVMTCLFIFPKVGSLALVIYRSLSTSIYKIFSLCLQHIKQDSIAKLGLCLLFLLWLLIRFFPEWFHEWRSCVLVWSLTMCYVSDFVCTLHCFDGNCIVLFFSLCFLLNEF